MDNTNAIFGCNHQRSVWGLRNSLQHFYWLVIPPAVAVMLKFWQLQMFIAGNLCLQGRDNGHPGLCHTVWRETNVFLDRWAKTSPRLVIFCPALPENHTACTGLLTIPGLLPRCTHYMRHCSDWLYVYPDACQGSWVYVGAAPRSQNQSGSRQAMLSYRERRTCYHRLKLMFIRSTVTCQL